MLSIRVYVYDTWRRCDGEYSSVWCTVYKIGRISKSKRNPRDLALITKWIWNALVISSTPLIEKRQLLCISCSGFHNTMDFSFSQFLPPVVCPPAMWTHNRITSDILISRIPLFYYHTLHSSSFILLPHCPYGILLYTSNEMICHIFTISHWPFPQKRLHYLSYAA